MQPIIKATCHNVKTPCPKTGVITDTYTLRLGDKVYGTASRSATGRDFNFFPANGDKAQAVPTMAQIKAYIDGGFYDKYLVKGSEGNAGTAGSAKVSGNAGTAGTAGSAKTGTAG